MADAKEVARICTSETACAGVRLELFGSVSVDEVSSFFASATSFCKPPLSLATSCVALIAKLLPSASDADPCAPGDVSVLGATNAFGFWSVWLIGAGSPSAGGNETIGIGICGTSAFAALFIVAKSWGAFVLDDVLPLRGGAEDCCCVTGPVGRCVPGIVAPIGAWSCIAFGRFAISALATILLSEIGATRSEIAGETSVGATSAKAATAVEGDTVGKFGEAKVELELDETLAVDSDGAARLSESEGAREAFAFKFSTTVERFVVSVCVVDGNAVTFCVAASVRAGVELLRAMDARSVLELLAIGTGAVLCAFAEIAAGFGEFACSCAKRTCANAGLPAALPRGGADAGLAMGGVRFAAILISCMTCIHSPLRVIAYASPLILAEFGLGYHRITKRLIRFTK
jgi:hypothetical protein